MIQLSKLMKAFGMVTVLSAFGKLFGFVREALIASFFGASGTADVFFVAFLIPTILFTALGTGIQAGIVPLYIQEKERSGEQASHLLQRLGSFFILSSAALTLLAYLLVVPLVHIFAPGFTNAQSDLAVILTMIMLPSLVFMTIQSLTQGVLHSNEKFGLPAWAPLVNNLVIILFMYLLYDWLGIHGLAIGVLIGSAMQLVIQLPGLQKGERIAITFKFWQEWSTLKKVLKPFMPIIIASLVVQLNLVVDRVVSSFLEEGSVSALNYGNRLLWLPLSIILMPISTILYPYLSRVATKGFQAFMDISNQGVKAIIMLAIPLQVVMVIEADSLVQLAFERGAFDDKASMLTSQAFVFFAVALPFFALRDYLMNSFYAFKLAKMAMYSCLYGVGLNILLSVSLAYWLGVGGVALATSLSMVFQTVFLYRYLVKQTVSGTERPAQHLFRLAGVLILLLIGSAGLHWLLPEMPILFSLIITTSFTFILYGLFLYIFRLYHLQTLFPTLTSKGES
ncbi:murein biosynthesis integral membrane protein MurJ [Thalassobacillus devorans]|uniref:murein biosynthesis integral membrane protein MurJ n=1 Tax=Thalassobacillus devorans TaxID=279813 RepID=UPI0004911241|nr:murein biosynthesis integral membrane protein MurJ [Thalassobacillus devorans]